MKAYYHNRYRFYKPDQKEHKIFAISDIHFSADERGNANLDRTAVAAENEAPKLITISGDLVDNLEAINTTANRARLKSWLERLGKVAPVCICIGNHDYYRKMTESDTAPNAKPGFIAEKNQTFIDEVNDLENVYYLDNSAYEDKEFYVTGLTLPPEYYQFDNKTKKEDSVINPSNEDLGILCDQIDLIKTTGLPKKKTKILLVHSPVHLMNESIRPRLAEFDFIFAGHMHNGVVPPLLNEIWRGRSGIITPDKHLFTDQNTRIGLYGDNLIVLGAVTTIQAGAGRISFMNRLFPTNITTVETSHNKNYARKPDIRKKYIK